MANKMTITVFDRYSILGKPPKDYCKGPCEGTGVVPVNKDVKKRSKELYKRWLAAEKKLGPTEDGYHFVKCPVCEGTKRRKK